MLAMFPSFPAQFLCMHGEGLRMYILQCMRHSCYGCRKADSPALPSVHMQPSQQLKAPIYFNGYTKTEKYAVCSKRVRFFLRGQYIGGGKLLNRRNTLDIKRSDIHCYLFIFHIESWEQKRWWPSRETDASATTGRGDRL